jgi:hypothetical protein
MSELWKTCVEVFLIVAAVLAYSLTSTAFLARTKVTKTQHELERS